MRVALLLLALVALVPACLAFFDTSVAPPEIIDASNIDEMWARGNEHKLKGDFMHFKLQHGKKYQSAEIEAARFDIFKMNMAKAAELQALNPEAEFGVTQFSDMHPLEFKNNYLNFRPLMGDSMLARRNAKVIAPTSKKALPENYDWRYPDQGRPVALTAVKNQGQCGSCWAFSAVEQLESAWIMAGNKPIALSPQQVVDCDKVDGGCNGGDTITAYDYMMEAGIMSEADYPYKARDQKCAYDKSKVVATMKSWWYATPECFDSCLKQDEELLAKNLYEYGPVSICVNASPWQYYKSGVMSAAGCKGGYYDLNHCTQLTGFGVDQATGVKYWGSRNSWGAGWGESGWIRLAYGSNTCGLASEATLIVV